MVFDQLSKGFLALIFHISGEKQVVWGAMAVVGILHDPPGRSHNPTTFFSKVIAAASPDWAVSLLPLGFRAFHATNLLLLGCAFPFLGRPITQLHLDW